jgi:hypothetical protein
MKHIDYNTFFNKVKGKKIRWTEWDLKHHTIPLELKGPTIGSMLCLNKPENNESQYWIMNGFDHCMDGYKWEYYIDMDDELDLL